MNTKLPTHNLLQYLKQYFINCNTQDIKKRKNCSAEALFSLLRQEDPNIICDQVSNLCQDLDATIFNFNIKTDLQRLLTNVQNTIQILFSRHNIEWEDLSDFVNRYLNDMFEIYRILVQYCVFEKQEFTSSILTSFLTLGCIWDKHPKATIFAPNYLSVIFEFFRHCISRPQTMDNASFLFQWNHFSTQLCAKTKWILSDTDRSLYCTEIRENRHYRLSFQKIENMEDVDAFHVINPLAVLEQIYQEIEIRPKDSSTYTIVFAGAISPDNINLLSSVLNSYLEKNQCRLHDLHVHIKICTSVPHRVTLLQYNKVSVDYQFLRYAWGSPKDWDNLIRQNELLFLFDIQKMHCFSFQPYPEINSYLQDLDKETYQTKQSFYDQTRSAFYAKSDIPQLMEILSAKISFSENYGLLRSCPNLNFLYYLQNTSMDYDTTIHCYISSFSPDWFNSFDNAISHKENVCGTTFTHVRFGKKPFKQLMLQEKSRAHILSFPLTSFLLPQLTTFTGSLYEKEFSNIYIGLDYSNWPKVRLIWWRTGYINESVYNKFRLLLQKVLIPCLQTTNQRDKCFLSFLYEAANSIDDLLFVHLFLNKNQSITIGEPVYESNFLPSYNLFADKHFYWQALQDYDSVNTQFVGEYTRLDQMKKAGLSLRFLHKQFLTACMRLHYQDSDLYRNSLQKLK